MKELSLLMFLLGCSYVIAQFINRFTASNTRRLNFYIPSPTQYNLLWGFIFYLGYITLKIPTEYKIWTILIIVFLLGCLFYFHGLYGYLQNPRLFIFKKDIAYRLKKQKTNDERLNRPYTRKEALRVLGLSNRIENDNPLLAKRMILLEQAAAQNPDFSYLHNLVKELHNALKNG